MSHDTAEVLMLQLTDERDICPLCVGRIGDNDAIETDPDGETVHEDCFSESCFVCHATGEIGWRDDAVMGPDDNDYGADYARHHIGSCDHCGDPMWSDEEIVTGGGSSICRSCYEECYFTCDGCGDVLRNRYYAENGYCQDCHEPEDEDYSDYIQPYENKSANHFGPFGKPKDGIYYGVELEVECPDGDRDSHARNALGELHDDYVILKNDCSLDNGFEIVTGPATIDVHAERFRGFLTGTAKKGLKSWNTSTCGMHVHVTRKPLTDLAIGKILVFMNDPENQGIITKVAGRSGSDYSRVERKRITDAHANHRDPRSSRFHSVNDRRSAVNVSGRKTIEFRIFKGTLKYESFLKNLEFVRAVVTFGQTTGIQELTMSHFLAHVSGRKKEFPHLVEFLRDNSFLPRPSKGRNELFRRIPIQSS